MRLIRSLRARALVLVALQGVFACTCGPGVATRMQDAVRRLLISPASASLPPGGTVTFVAVGAPPASVDWSASAGTITSGGVYTAPAELGAYQIRGRYQDLTGEATANVVAPGSPGALHGEASSTCAGMPLRSTGTILYFCDCQAGAQTGCVAGSDSNPGTSASAPKQTWGAAVAAFNAMNAGDTIALCKGGFWNVPATGDCGGQWENTRCAAGTNLKDAANTSTCDVRDYQASWGGTAKPVLYANATNATTRIVSHWWGHALVGVRILNLEFRGNNLGPTGGVYNNSNGISLGSCGPSNDSDWLVCNNTFSNMRLGMVLNNNGAYHSKFTVWGNRFLMNDLDAILGGPGADSTFDANLFDNNGGQMPHDGFNYSHTLYPTAPGVTGASIVNNEIRYSSVQCNAAIISGHGNYDGLLIENNILDGGANPQGHCWGTALDSGGGSNMYLRNTLIRRNRVVAGGVGIGLAEGPGSVIENNAITIKGSSSWAQAIYVPDEAACSGCDVQGNTTVRNNSILMAMTGGGVLGGISVGVEGTGYVIANNAIEWLVGAGTCFGTGLSAGAYTFVGNNACHGSSWGTTYDATTHITSDPLFASSINFTPRPGSPLIGAGNPAYAPPTDFTLVKTRPNPPSIGAFEP
jgi:hypothetical protein